MFRLGFLAVINGRGSTVVMRWLLLCVLWISTPRLADSARMCPSRCSCRDAELVVDCPNAQLDMVPYTLHPGLRSLSLHGNQIKQVSGTSFTAYSTLRSLDLSANQLVDVGRRAFASLPDLEVLDLSRNMIATLSNTTLEGLGQLSQLDLAFNYIENLPGGILQEMSQLLRLDLSHNHIKRFQDADGFRGAKKLRVLSLRDNKLSAIPSNALRHLAELAFLDLGMNDFTDLPAEAFLPLRTLEDLRLDGCKLQTVQPGAFRALGSLRVLYLQDNQLEDTPSTSFSDIPRLEEIHIGQNPITQLRDRAFQHLRQLRILGLSGATELRRLEANALIDNQQLEQLILSQNVRLSLLDPATFRPLSTLRRVNLRANALTSLPADLLPLAWEHLEELDIRDNPLVCNCSLRWLLAKRRQQHLLLMQPQGRKISSSSLVNGSMLESSLSPFANDTTRIKCVAPSHLAGVYIDEVASEDALDCNGWSRVIRTALVASAGCLLVLFAGVLFAACCAKYRNKMTVIPCEAGKPSQNSGPVGGKHIGQSEWLPTSLNEKTDYALSQTRLPSSEQHNNATEDAEGNGVYICQLSTGRMRQPTAQQQLRNLQTLPNPDLLELCRAPDSGLEGFTSVSRQSTARVIFNSSTAAAAAAAALREPKISNGRAPSKQSSPAQEDNVQIPFCYYFE
ncbi:insulin growth factor-binding protein complex acid labile subunit-like [Tropilaelaps mercedesae]|uniref:Insulin growth factor-binding protein complex acid labile subunit-like n=1 Tax=Tropilaelaps mercedesae TaxID=418985 RepID=A0A1V9XTF1_9ACAR|nr:insulin growth factor-binding protein complex acid labile subunit-like [Tropilaelaps mercedesae]